MNDMKSVEIELTPNASSLYLLFGGGAGAMGMPRPEFYSSSKITEQNKIFLRDHSICWYQNGLVGIGPDIQSIARYLQSQIERLKPEKIFFVGNSMGGYAAILFNELIGRGESIAFAPQTFVSPFLHLKNRDFRWRRQIFIALGSSLFKKHIWDVRSLLRKQRKNRKVSIFVSKNDRLDLVHATHVEGCAGVHVHKFEDGGHGIVALLRDEGKLPAIMSGTYV